MSWLMSYVLILAAAVIPTIRAGMPKRNNCFVISFYKDLESVLQSENGTVISLLLVIRQEDNIHDNFSLFLVSN